MGMKKQSKTEKTGSNRKLDDEVGEASKMQMIKRKTWMTKRREKWLVGLGVILHAVYMLSIFDIYFKSPIVHGMDPVKPRFSPPAKRLVLIIGNLSHCPFLYRFNYDTISLSFWIVKLFRVFLWTAVIGKSLCFHFTFFENSDMVFVNLGVQ